MRDCGERTATAGHEPRCAWPGWTSIGPSRHQWTAPTGIITKSCIRTGTVSDTVPVVVDNNRGDASSTVDVFAADLLRGHTDTIVLAVLSRDDRYGFENFKRIRDATG